MKGSKNYIFGKILFQEDFRCFKSKETIEFRPGLNVIVGDQGCGKSSLFYSILNWKESKIAMHYDSSLINDFSFLDTESMNPRLENAFKAGGKEYKTIEGYDSAKLEHFINKLSKYDEQSHGEVMLPLILASKSSKEGCKTFFFDEPEAGLSLRSQNKILKHLKELAKNNQVFIATHSLIIIQQTKEVLSLEHKKWMTSKEFIKSQKN